MLFKLDLLTLVEVYAIHVLKVVKLQQTCARSKHAPVGLVVSNIGDLTWLVNQPLR